MHAMAVHARPAEVRQQGRMDVDHPSPKSRDHGRGHELQVARQHDELRVAEGGLQLVGVIRITQDCRRDSGAACAVERTGIGPAGNYARNACNGRTLKGVEEGLQVRAAARDEHGDTNRPFCH